MKVLPRIILNADKYKSEFPSESTRLIVFDTETTGLNPHTDEIIEIGAIEYFQDQETRRFHSFGCPSGDISEEVSKIHGLTRDSLEHHPPTLSLIYEFLNWTGSFKNTCLVGHNLKFDMEFLLKGISDLNSCTPVPVPEEGFCTYRFLKLAFDATYSLDSACRVFEITEVKDRNIHTAIVDASLTALLYFKLKAWKFHTDTPGILVDSLYSVPNY